MAEETKIFVGNLSWNTTDDSLRSGFSQFGEISDSIVLKDRETGRSRGFGFISFSNADDAQAAIQGMNEQDLDGRSIRVNLANERPSGGGNSGGYSIGGRSRDGYRGGGGRREGGGGYGGNGGG
ncbi:hypothetical protein HK096_011493, partial [Nowakowskiella sp. JEL0078]